ncbi:MAG: hypothetical protein ACWA41_10385 [Putridiphycobacter sp.]
MNKLQGEIIEVVKKDALKRVEVLVSGVIIHVLLIDEQEEYVQGDQVELLFKPMATILAKQPFNTLSILNQLPVTIMDSKVGEILTEYKLNFGETELTALILNADKQHRHLTGEEVIAAIKSNQIMLHKL